MPAGPEDRLITREWPGVQEGDAEEQTHPQVNSNTLDPYSPFAVSAHDKFTPAFSEKSSAESTQNLPQEEGKVKSLL